MVWRNGIDDYTGMAVHGILAIIVKIKQQRLNLTLQDKQNPITNRDGVLC
jgi:hypothetical protein